MTDNFPLALAVMAAAALICRMAGFTLMRFVPLTPRVEAALRATPLAVMSGIVVLTLAKGGLAEALALGVVVAMTWATGRDVAAALLGVAVVAGLRGIGM